DGMTIIIILLFVAFIAILINRMGVEVSNSPNAQLTQDSEAYLTEITANNSGLGFDTSFYLDDIENPLVDETGDSKDEFAIDFNFGKRKAGGFSKFLYAVLNVPEFIFIDLFKFPTNGFKWVVDLLDWLYRIIIFVAIYAFVRGKV
ncbi:unnamed protein product, partial [marine sediment metagenome]